MNQISACVICYNEIEMLPHCLEYLNSLQNLDEICLLDSFSNDGTWEYANVIFKSFTKKKYICEQRKFESFGEQKNRCIEMAENGWILSIDADETYSRCMDVLLGDIKNNKLKRYNAIRIMTYITWPDKQHYINPEWLDPHVRIWRKDFCKYKGDCHEMLFDNHNRNLHESYHKDILTLDSNSSYGRVVMLHHQRLKSELSLIEKGIRWEQLDMLRKSAEQKLPVDKTSWLEYKRQLVRGEKEVFPIPPQSWDYQ